MEKDQLAGIYHFVPIDERLSTGGQPSEDELHLLAAAGCQCVINLGLTGTDYALADEAGLAHSLGLRYHHIPVDFAAPSQEDLDAFFSAMEAEGDRRLFVHCAANYRVACFVALYGEAKLGWSQEQADRHIRRIWEPDAVWREFVRAAQVRISRGA